MENGKIRTQAKLLKHKQTTREITRTTTRTKLSRSILLWTVCRVEYEVFLQIESILMLNPQLSFYKKVELNFKAACKANFC